MITSAEAKLGRNMAVVAAAGLILSILIPVVLIGIDGGNGYNPTWGPLSNIVNFVQDIATVFTVVLLMKLLVADDKPVFRVMSMIMIVVGTMWAIRDLAPTAAAQSVWSAPISATEVDQIMNLFNFGSFVLLSIWWWTAIDADGGELLPRYAVIAGRLAAGLFILLHVLSFFGQSLGLNPNIAIPFWLAGGLILWPLSIYGVSRAFAKKM
ncbi:MAG: hypothetical protein MK000_03055 [Anaerolineales bacterium]|nr:hypothetical protein [Anaerolineales bacterium]